MRSENTLTVNKIMKIITLLSSIILLIALSSCSRNATWHLNKAKELEPGLFEIDTTIIESPKVTTEIDCDSISKIDGILSLFSIQEETGDSVKVEIKTVYKYRDREVPKEVYRALSKSDSLNISKALQLGIECPDSKIIEKEVPIPVKLTPWEKVEYVISGALMLAFLYALFLVLKGVFKKKSDYI